MIDGMVESELRLELENVLAVPQERVFAAFVDAEQLRRWWGPAGFSVSHLEFDAVEGASYRIAMQPPEGEIFHISGVFLAVEPPRRLVFTFVYEEPDPDDQETVVTARFEPGTDSGTQVMLDHGPFKTAPRQQLHRDGWTQTLERLDEFLA